MKTRSPATRPGILLVGAGEHGFHAVLPGILSMGDDLRLVGVVEAHAPNRQRLAAAHAQVPQFNDLATALAATNPDIVYLASLPEQHLEQGLLALAHGCHVVCEKPLTPSVADTARLVDAATKADRLLVTPFLNRYRPHYRRIREWVLAGAIGRVEAIHFMHYWYGSGKSPAERLAYYAQTGGSLDCGIHYLDLARFVVGAGTWKDITAMGRWFDEPDMAFPVAISILARFDDGPIVTYNDSIAYHELRTLDIHHKYVLGTAGMIVQESAGIRLIRTAGTGDFIAHHPSNHAEEIPWLLADLLATMEGLPTASGFLPTGRDGLIAQEVVAEAHRQALRHRAEVPKSAGRKSSAGSLAARERVLSSIRFKSGDRVPVVGGFVRHPAFLAATAGVSIEQFWLSPRRVAIEAFRRLGVDVILGLILPNQDSATGAQVEHARQTEFRSPEDVRDYVARLPEPQAVAATFDHAAVAARYAKEVSEGQEACNDALWIPNGIHRYCTVFDHASRFGYENYVMALTLYPGVMERLFAHDGERAFQTNRAVAEATARLGLVPVVWTGTDACDNRGPFVRPELMQRIYFPHLKRALAPLREAGIAIIWHSDGCITPIAADLIEAGVDGFQGLQEKTDTKVDVAELSALRTQSGRPPVFIGSISSTVTMPFGTEADVRQEVNRWRAFACARGGGVLLNFSSSLGPEVPMSNIQTFFDAASQNHPHSGRRP